ncbi:MAG: hypothetical protein AB1547_06440, partial [Thermodesulfobacteriota bacterium]
LNRNGLLFNRYFDPIRPSDPTISGGFKHVFAASSKGFPSHPADARHLQKAREKRLVAGPSRTDQFLKNAHHIYAPKASQARMDTRVFFQRDG